MLLFSMYPSLAEVTEMHVKVPVLFLVKFEIIFPFVSEILFVPVLAPLDNNVTVPVVAGSVSSIMTLPFI